jgi:hypothetical protein
MAKRKPTGKEDTPHVNRPEGPSASLSQGEKVISSILTTIIVPLVGFAMLAEYRSLEAFDGVKWDQGKRVSDISEGKTEILHIYRFGEKPLQDVMINFIFEPPEDYKIESASLQRYERSLLGLLLSPHKYEAHGSAFTEGGVAYSFRVDELSSDWIYELTLEIKSLKGTPVSHYGALELRSKEGTEIGDKGLSSADYLRLYISAVVLGGIVALAAFGFGTWWGIRGIIRRSRRRRW